MMERLLPRPRVLVPILFFGAILASEPASATTFTVTNTNDANAGSLRQAIIDANADGTATVGMPHLIDATGVSGMILLASELTMIENHIRINGPTALDLIVDGAGMFTPCVVSGLASPVVEISYLIFQNGFGIEGGGVFNDVSLTLDHCWIRGNTATDAGGGVYNQQEAVGLNLINCLVSGNIVTGGDGGGLSIIGFGDVSFVNTVVVGNSASGAGGGLNLNAAMFTGRGGLNSFANTIIALNTASSDPDISNINGIFPTTLGGNLIGNNVGIATGFDVAGSPNATGDYVGTMMFPIDPDFVMDVPAAPSIGGDLQVNLGSLAIDNGDDLNVGVGLTVDLIGRPRIFSTVDIGAYEFGSTACRLGNVNAGGGAITDVLFVNGSAGTGFDRRVVLNRNGPIQISMSAPPSLASPSFVAYAFAGDTFPNLERVLPGGVGTFCIPTPLTDPGAPPLLAPLEIWNNLGFTPMLGESTRPSAAAPSMFVDLPDGTGRALTVFIQALIRDDFSLHGQIAVTNGVTIVIP